jgi:hypothetical protein
LTDGYFHLGVIAKHIGTLRIKVWAQRTSQRNQETARSGHNDSDQHHRISGKVIGTKQLTLRGSQGQQRAHTLARLEINDGKVIPLALGPKERLEPLNIRKGQRLNVQAVPGTIDGRTILVAQRVSAGDQSVQFQHSGYPTFRSANGSTAQQTRTVRGEIDGFKHVDLRSSARDRQQHSLVRIKLENGRSQVVALGPKRDMDDFNFRVGMPIVITGQPGRIDGREVLFAERIRVGNQTHKINWPRQQRDGGTFAVRGTVQGYQVVTVSSGGKKQALLNLRLQDGRSILVDAGPKNTPGELTLDQLTLNDEVIIQ